MVERLSNPERARTRLMTFAACSLLSFVAACGGANVESRGDANDVRDTTSRPSDTVKQVERPMNAPASNVGRIASRGSDVTPIDTTPYDARIKSLETSLRERAGDAGAKRELATAYATRAARLTEVRQYQAALGDWRRAATLDPANEQAQTMIATITGIMQSMNRPVPAPGTEPTPVRK